MKGIIRIGDKSTGGGTVLSGSTVLRFEGIGVSPEGDLVRCPVAFDRHQCACSYALFSSWSMAGAN
jgi:uncharacterized Zn-binding protein involved in type VI secretion